MPWLLAASTASLVALLGAALAHRSYVLAAQLVLLALCPILPRERLRVLGVVLSWVGIAACVVSIVLVPLGARVTAVYLPGALVLGARIVILRAASVVRWASGDA